MTNIHARCIANVQRVKKTSLAALSAAVALGTSVAGGVAAGPAYAYPPGTGLAVTATPIGTPNKHRHQQFAVQIVNGRPGCTVTISGGEKPVRATIGADGTASGTVEAKYRKGTATITAKTRRCRGAKERTSTRIALSAGEVHGPQTVKHGHRIDFALQGWIPHRRVYVVATNGRHTHRFTGWPNHAGQVSVHFWPERKGSWAVVVMQDGASASVNITVT